MAGTRMRLALLLSILIALSTSMDQFDSSAKVTYGSVLKMTNPASQLIVHSHDVFFGRGGVMSVTGYQIDDLGSYWQIGEPFKAVSKTVADPVLCGDSIALSSAIEGYSLRVEETQFGLTTELLPMVHGMKKDGLDQKINWKLQCVNKEEGVPLTFQDEIRLKHAVTGKYASLDPAYAYTEANCGRGCSIAGQIELHAIDSADEATSVFQVRSGIAFDPELVERQTQ